MIVPHMNHINREMIRDRYLVKEEVRDDLIILFYLFNIVLYALVEFKMKPVRNAPRNPERIRTAPRLPAAPLE
jgi:hypothetical protein